MIANAIKSIDTLAERNVLTDVRTTVFADTSYENLVRIAQLVNGIGKGGMRFWTLRNYDPVPGLNWTPKPDHILLDWVDDLSRRFPNVPIGYRRAWFDGKLVCVTAGQHMVL